MGIENRIQELFADLVRVSEQADSAESCLHDMLSSLARHSRGASACLRVEIGRTVYAHYGEVKTDVADRLVEYCRMRTDSAERPYWAGTELVGDEIGTAAIGDGIVYPLRDNQELIGAIGIFQLEDESSAFHPLVAGIAIPYIVRTCSAWRVQTRRNEPSPAKITGETDTGLPTESSRFLEELQEIARGVIDDTPVPAAADAIRKALRLHSCVILLIDRIQNSFAVSGMSTKATKAESRQIESLSVTIRTMEIPGFSQNELNRVYRSTIGDYLDAALSEGSLKTAIKTILESHRRHRVVRVPLFDSFRRLQGFILLIREPNQKQFPGEMNMAAEMGSRLSDAFQIRNSIYFDYLTGLPNLRRIRPIATDKLISADPFTLLICKITNLKDLVIARGDEYVDRCIVNIAQKVKHYTRQKARNTHIGRNSGEASFTFIIPHVDYRRVRAFVEGLVGLALEPIDVDGNPVHLYMSVGACFSTDIWDSDMVFNYSKLAIQSIAGEKNAYCIFDFEKQQAYQDEVELEDDLQVSMSSEHFLPFYQPKVLCDGSVIGYEALVRWERNNRIEYPGLFVEKVEKLGLIQGMFDIVFEKVCRELNAGTDLRNVSINISPSQLASADLMSSIRSRLSAFGIDPTMITLEFVETAIVNSEYFEAIKELKELGFKLSVDDFGTGFARYKTLLDLFNQGLIHEIKIDKVFVDSIESAANQNFVRSIAYLAHEFGIQIVIEGVETIEQFQMLKSIDSGFIIQGWLVSKAMPIEGVSQFDERNVQNMLRGI